MSTRPPGRGLAFAPGTTQGPVAAPGLAERIGRQLGDPAGRAGALLGRAMRVVNARANRLSVEALRIEPEDHVLDLGCGPGHAVRLAAARARLGVVRGIDRSPVMVAAARARNRDLVSCGRLVLCVAGWERLPLADASVDRVLAVNVAYFWDAAALREARRVLRPGGTAAIYVTDAAAMRRWPFAGPATHRLYDAASLCASVRDGFPAPDEVEVRPVHAGPGVPGLLALVRRAL